MTKWKFSDATTPVSLDYQIEQPKITRIELEDEEKTVYQRLFGEEGRKVQKPLKECLEEFVSLGFHENPEYLDVIEIAYKCIDEEFDSVEKNGFHVINDETDVEVLCRHREDGEWRFVACIERDLIQKFKKNMHSTLSYYSGSGGRRIENSTTIGYNTIK